jgi:hypothetical protein
VSGSDVIVITPISPAGPSISVRMTGDLPTPTFAGGWNSVARPTRRAFTQWDGPTAAINLTVPILIDGFAEDRSVETQISQIEALMFPTFVGPPPICKITGQFSQSQWSYVLNGIEYGETERRRSDGARTRQYMTLTFLEYVAADTVVSSKSPAQSVAKAVTKTTPVDPAVQAYLRALNNGKSGTAVGGSTYTVKAGDSLAHIAAKFGVSWKTLASLNGIRDPNKLKVGQVLRIK